MGGVGGWSWWVVLVGVGVGLRPGGVVVVGGLVVVGCHAGWWLMVELGGD